MNSFTIADLIDVDITKADSGKLTNIWLRSPSTSFDLLSFLPNGYRVRQAYLSGCDPTSKVIDLKEAPDFETIRDLPDEDKFAKSMGMNWLLETMHEVGHIHEGFQYSESWESVRDRALTQNVYAKIGDMVETLQDELGANGFALRKLRDLDPGNTLRDHACAVVTQVLLKSYMSGMLSPMKVRTIQRHTPEQFKKVLLSVYQEWADSEIPDFGLNIGIAYAMADAQVHSYRTIRDHIESGQRVIGVHPTQFVDEVFDSISRVSRAEIYVPDGFELPKRRFNWGERKIEKRIRQGDIDSSKPAIQIIDDLSSSHADINYMYVSPTHIDYNAPDKRLRSLGRHFHMALGVNCTLIPTDKLDLIGHFGLTEFQGYDGIIFG